MNGIKNVDFDTVTKRMQNIVNRTLKGYKSDFEIDKQIMMKAQTENNTVAYIWITRELGTHIVRLNAEQEDYLSAIRKNWEKHNEYSLVYNPGDGWSLKKETKS